jgi:hypothetical protein
VLLGDGRLEVECHLGPDRAVSLLVHKLGLLHHLQLRHRKALIMAKAESLAGAKGRNECTFSKGRDKTVWLAKLRSKTLVR